MSVDSLLREQGRRLRDEVAVSLDVERSWDRLDAARRRRRRTAGLVTAAAAAASFVVAVAFLDTWPAAVDRDTAPVDTPTGAPASPAPTDGCVESEVVQCLGDGMVRVRGDVNYRFIIPSGFSPQMEISVGNQATDVYQKHRKAGVSVMTDAVPAGPDVGELDARGLASWVASRPYLEIVDVRRERLNGRAAWSVEIASSPYGALWRGRDPELAETCNGQLPSCRPLLRSPNGHESGPWADMTSRYWFMDVPGDGVTALWSWTFEDAPEALALNETLVGSVVVESAS